MLKNIKCKLGIHDFVIYCEIYDTDLKEEVDKIMGCTHICGMPNMICINCCKLEPNYDNFIKRELKAIKKGYSGNGCVTAPGWKR